MSIPASRHGYFDPTVALHLHDYAGTIRIGRRTFHLEPGDITLTPARTESRYELTAAGTHLCLHFSPARTTSKTISLPLHFRTGPRVAAARERFWRVIDYVRRAGGDMKSPANAAASAVLQELLLWLHLQAASKDTGMRPHRADEALARLRGIIDASLARELTVPGLAREAGLSADYMARLFRRRHAMSIPRYLLLRRIELARHLLRSGEQPIRHVGRQCGIADPQYFNKQFRRIVGVSPSRYRWQAGQR